jgi:hypothetical protein
MTGHRARSVMLATLLAAVALILLPASALARSAGETRVGASAILATPRAGDSTPLAAVSQLGQSALTTKECRGVGRQKSVRPLGGPCFAPLRFRVAASNKGPWPHTYRGWTRSRLGLTSGCLVKAPPGRTRVDTSLGRQSVGHHPDEGRHEGPVGREGGRGISWPEATAFLETGFG